METAYSWAAQGGHVRSNSSKTAITAGTLGGTLSGASNDNFDRRHVGGFRRVKNAIIKDTSVRFARARDGLATAEFQSIGLSIGASLRISVNVTADFGNVTDSARLGVARFGL